MPYTVFVGHSGEDYDLVEAIQDAARPKGIRIYAYEQDLQPGATSPRSSRGESAPRTLS